MDFSHYIYGKMTRIIQDCENSLSNIRGYRDMNKISAEDKNEIGKFLFDLEIMVLNIINMFGGRYNTGLYDRFGTAIHLGDILKPIDNLYEANVKVLRDKPYEAVKFYDEENDALWYLNQTDVFRPNEINQLNYFIKESR